MTIEVNALVETYTIMKEYVSPKDRQAAADHVMSILVDSGVNDQDLKILANSDSYLKRASKEYLDVDGDDLADEENDYDYDE